LKVKYRALESCLTGKYQSPKNEILKRQSSPLALMGNKQKATSHDQKKFASRDGVKLTKFQQALVFRIFQISLYLGSEAPESPEPSQT
jgi:hypothetical protein